MISDPLETIRDGLREAELPSQNGNAGSEQHVAMIALRSTGNCGTGLAYSDLSAGWGRLLLP